MRAKINGENNSAWLTAALCLALTALGLLHFGGTGTKWLTLLAGAGIIVLLLRGDRRKIWNAPSLLLLGYAAWSWLTIFWAMSGKFHLREWSKILAVVVLTLCGNLYAASKISAPVGSADEFMSNLSTAARLDLYEHNDKKLSYVIASMTEGDGAYRAQADEYAAQLAKAQSNTIPRYLVDYYLQTQQYGKAVDEAILGATYSASDAETWNSCAEPLNEALFESMFSPLLQEEYRAELMAKLTDYYSALQRCNSSALKPLALSEQAQAFFDKIPALNGCMNDNTEFIVTMFTE